MYTFFYGILLGFGAAIPIGPINLEIIRRNLSFGTQYGLALGLGACLADVTYLILISLGFFAIANLGYLLDIFALLGSALLIWFAWGAVNMPLIVDQTEKYPRPDTYPPIRHGLEGYGLTLINPYTILFWLSVSSQISKDFVHQNGAIFTAVLGVLIGTFGWVVFLNYLLQMTHRYITSQFNRVVNYIGAAILLIFALLGFYRVLF